jgi:hypothetical protein
LEVGAAAVQVREMANSRENAYSFLAVARLRTMHQTQGW